MCVEMLQEVHAVTNYVCFNISLSFSNRYLVACNKIPRAATQVG